MFILNTSPFSWLRFGHLYCNSSPRDSILRILYSITVLHYTSLWVVVPPQVAVRDIKKKSSSFLSCDALITQRMHTLRLRVQDDWPKSQRFALLPNSPTSERDTTGSQKYHLFYKIEIQHRWMKLVRSSRLHDCTTSWTCNWLGAFPRQGWIDHPWLTLDDWGPLDGSRGPQCVES